MAIATGQGATLAFGTTASYLPSYTSIGGPGWTRDSLDTTGLSTTGSRTMIGADLWTIAPISCSFLFDPSLLATTAAGSIDDLLFDSGDMTADESSITLTLGNTEASTFATSGHVTELQIEELSIDSLMAASLTFQWASAPTVTE